MLKITSLALLFFFGLGTAEDKMIPPNLENSAAFGCWVFGDADATAKTKIFAQYTDGTKTFIAVYSERNNATDAMEDCIRWDRAVIEELKEAQKRKEGRAQR